ncbi:MAG: sulfotransferase family 2 domain-containing protein [Rhodobacteraceae bacterium]|nr:sulfotransferase family 2 domain-containing protein [Paracoccaceae bacterium]
MTAILDDFKLAYVAVPKVACTSIKNMMFEVENGFKFREFKASGRYYWIHDLYRSVPFTELRKPRLDACWRLAVVRDPIQRLLSCYSNRVIHHRELSPQKARRALREADLPFNPDLSTFVSHLVGYMAVVESIHHHARPMVDYLGSDASYYNRLYGMKELGAFAADVQRITGKTAELPRLQTGGPKIEPDALTAAEKTYLRELYAEDYDVFGAKL